MTNSARNDLVKGLRRKVVVRKKGNKKFGKPSFGYSGKYGQGYDGCGCHTHKD